MATHAGTVRELKLPELSTSRNCQLVIGEPPLLLVVHDSATCPSPGTAFSERGRPGVVATVIGPVSAAAPLPRALTART